MINRLIFIALIIFSTTLFAQHKVIIDADTGNEVDDLYALTRGLIDPGWDVVGINATQWQASQWAVPKSMENSYRLNQVILSYLNLSGEVVSNRGAERRLFDWGNKTQTSQASQFIINEASKLDGDKLTVIAVGALTNVASAILDQPEITDKIRLYWLGSSYNFEEQYMKNIDFNSVMDIQAVDVVLTSDVELHIMPVNVAAAMTYQWEETRDQLQDKHDLLDFLLQRWYNHLDGGREQRVLWDLALIEAIIHPELAQKVTVTLGKGKGDREVNMYRSIDADQMRSNFFEIVNNYFSK
jgi:inosine-uridine nucleoside N-ribohydrolase